MSDEYFDTSVAALAGRADLEGDASRREGQAVAAGLLDHLTPENRELLELARRRDQLQLANPELQLNLLKPCRVRVLLVADGGLDFSLNDFGLRTFVEALRTIPAYYVRFDLTLAHINDVTDDAVMAGQPGISRSIKRFKFDDTSHFTPTMYDQVWLFGIATSYFRGNSPAGTPYPNNRLGDAELRALSEFMNGGGGLFATGDHGALGVCLSGSVPRARSMRLWGDTSPSDLDNEVSMSGRRRNDTNRIGPSGGSQFNDQSDDVPQRIAPRMYTRQSLIWRFSYPHPLLCGPRGVIRVLPDHPHEGQCVVPTNTERTDTFAGFTIVEYPPGTGGSPRPLPEVIATSSVLAGTTSGGKQPTQAHTFGAIGAYDGHRAGVGRVVTDATWHHFVNVNLIGDSSAAPGDPKRVGFLFSATGQAHLENIKTYYRNIAVWLSPPARLTCMRRRIFWGLLWHHRIIEAVTARPEISLRQAGPNLVYAIGRHARDVLGLYAGQCQSQQLILDLIAPLVSRDLLRQLDPWVPPPEKGQPVPEPEPVPWFDPDPILDLAIGGALVALREGLPELDNREKANDAAIDKAVERGLKAGIDLSVRSAAAVGREFGSFFAAVKTDTARLTAGSKQKRPAKASKRKK